MAYHNNLVVARQMHMPTITTTTMYMQMHLLLLRFSQAMPIRIVRFMLRSSLCGYVFCFSLLFLTFSILTSSSSSFHSPQQLVNMATFLVREKKKKKLPSVLFSLKPTFTHTGAAASSAASQYNSTLGALQQQPHTPDYGSVPGTAPQQQPATHPGYGQVPLPPNAGVNLPAPPSHGARLCWRRTGPGAQQRLRCTACRWSRLTERQRIRQYAHWSRY
jgi:hypothetical protein